MRATWTAAALAAALTLTPVASAAAVALPRSDTPQPITTPALPTGQPAASAPSLPTLPTTPASPVAESVTSGKVPGAVPATPTDGGPVGGLLPILTGLLNTVTNLLSNLLGIKLAPIKLPELPSLPGGLEKSSATTRHLPADKMAELQRTLDALHAAEAAARPAS
ncbi:hypothetical protein [Streptomyces crystallinus]|uniref:Secreted protein n=1 Tax=Streptomyces crystallinus TaxID=68191 RepID=A0ABN1FN90_9ACTN